MFNASEATCVVRAMLAPGNYFRPLLAIGCPAVDGHLRLAAAGQASFNSGSGVPPGPELPRTRWRTIVTITLTPRPDRALHGTRRVRQSAPDACTAISFRGESSDPDKETGDFDLGSFVDRDRQEALRTGQCHHAPFLFGRFINTMLKRLAASPDLHTEFDGSAGSPDEIEVPL